MLIWKNSTVVPRYNDHLYNGSFDFQLNFIGNGSFLIKIYYIKTEFALSDTDGDSRRQNAFLYTSFYSLKRQKKSSDKLFTNKTFQLAVNRYAHCRAGTQGWQSIDRPGKPRWENPGFPGLGNTPRNGSTGQYWVIKYFPPFSLWNTLKLHVLLCCCLS